MLLCIWYQFPPDCRLGITPFLQTGCLILFPRNSMVIPAQGNLNLVQIINNNILFKPNQDSVAWRGNTWARCWYCIKTRIIAGSNCVYGWTNRHSIIRNCATCYIISICCINVLNIWQSDLGCGNVVWVWCIYCMVFNPVVNVSCTCHRCVTGFA